MKNWLTSWLQKGWPPLLVVILLFAVWQAAVAIWNIPDWLLPGPLDVLREGAASYSRLIEHILSSVRIALYGFAAGVAVGLFAAVLLHALLPWLKPGFYPLLVLSQNIPIIALAPLLVIWFGYGILPKIIIITLVCFFPVTIAALEGFTQADKNILDYMRMIGANRRQIFFKLELPAALPYIFSGLQISATYCVSGAVISEWLGAKQGLGVYMLLSQSSFRTDRIFVAIFIIVSLSLALFLLILLLKKLLIRYQTKQ
jgi:ABC-type nitrate/sulfonate/bicarbonate transport system permease component